MVFITSTAVGSEILRQQALTKEIGEAQNKVSSGKKLAQPSDDPQDWIQISTIGRQQQLTSAWQSNLKFAMSRSDQATSSLTDINNLMNRVTELLVTGTSTNSNTPGAEAVAQELTGIRDTIKSVLNQTDYQGRPTFDDAKSVGIPVGQGLTVEAVGTRQSVEQGIVTPTGTKTIYDVLDAAITAVRNGDKAGKANSLTEARAALDHIIVAQSQQGVRAQRLDNEQNRVDAQDTNLTIRRSALEDTDLTEVLANLQAKLVTLQAAQTTFAKVSQQTLFNIIS